MPAVTLVTYAPKRTGGDVPPVLLWRYKGHQIRECSECHRRFEDERTLAAHTRYWHKRPEAW